MTSKRFVLALAGGVGGGKMARGLAAVLAPEQLAVAVNTADDFVHLGLHISPDIDSVLYAMADQNDLERGWGLAGETWNFMDAMARLGGETWFKLGDHDLATHVLRTQALAAGQTLSQVTAMLARRLDIAHTVVPMTDDAVRSIVMTGDGELDFQDYFVRRQCKPVFRGVRFKNIDTAMPSTGLCAALARARAVIITPSNPFVSIDPILALPGMKDALGQHPVVAVSPIIGGQSVKGPLGKMMRELGNEPSPLGVARHYGRLVGGWVIDSLDREFAPAIKALGCRVKICNTLMRTLDDKRRLAHDTVELAFEMAGKSVD